MCEGEGSAEQALDTTSARSNKVFETAMHLPATSFRTSRLGWMGERQVLTDMLARLDRALGLQARPDTVPTGLPPAPAFALTRSHTSNIRNFVAIS